jgi:hypothetical protein
MLYTTLFIIYPSILDELTGLVFAAVFFLRHTHQFEYSKRRKRPPPSRIHSTKQQEATINSTTKQFP